MVLGQKQAQGHLTPHQQFEWAVPIVVVSPELAQPEGEAAWEADVSVGEMVGVQELAKMKTMDTGAQDQTTGGVASEWRERAFFRTAGVVRYPLKVQT